MVHSTVRARGAAATAVLALTALAVVPVPASGAAAGPASCMGHEASNISPPGSSAEEFAGGMPEFNAFVAANFPGPPGAAKSEFARVRAGSHEQCDVGG